MAGGQTIVCFSEIIDHTGQFDDVFKWVETRVVPIVRHRQIVSVSNHPKHDQLWNIHALP